MRLLRRWAGYTLVSLAVAAGSAAGAVGAAAPRATGRTGFLFGVAAVGTSRAWAVGQRSDGIAPRLLRRNAAGWRSLPAPPGGEQAELHAISVVAPAVEWAVGDTGEMTYTARRSRGRWHSVPSPSFGLDDTLAAVSGTSRTDVWAVGSHLDSGEENSRTLALHWDGSAWRAVATPDPFDFPTLSGVAAVSPRRAWAVGSTGVGTLILHWNGTTWQRVAAPGDAWSVGDTGRSALVLHRVGATWRRLRLPTDGRSSALYGVAAVSPHDIWAVGRARRPTHAGTSVAAPLVLHWNGSRWHVMPTPDPRRDTVLTAVSARSGDNAWAVGYSGDDTSARTVVLHWDGSRWTVE